MYSFVPNLGGVKLLILGKKRSNSFNYYKRMTLKAPPAILRNLDNFPPVAFYSTPTITHKITVRLLNKTEQKKRKII